MPFDNLEDAQEETDVRQFPGAVPLGMRITNMGANWMPQPGMTRVPPGDVPPDLRADAGVGGEQQETQSMPAIGQRIIDLSSQQRMPSRISRPDPMAPMLVASDVPQQRRMLDGLMLGLNDQQSTSPSALNSPVVDMTQQMQTPSRIQEPPQAPAATPQAGQSPGQPPA